MQFFSLGGKAESKATPSRTGLCGSKTRFRSQILIRAIITIWFVLILDLVQNQLWFCRLVSLFVLGLMLV